MFPCCLLTLRSPSHLTKDDAILRTTVRFSNISEAFPSEKSWLPFMLTLGTLPNHALSTPAYGCDLYILFYEFLANSPDISF